MTTKINSKVRRVFGTQTPSQEHYNSVKFQPLSAESNPLRANKRFYAFPWKAKGAVGVCELKSVGAVPDELPLLEFDEEDVTDFDFNPFDDNMMGVTYNETFKVFSIPEGGMTSGISASVTVEKPHDKRLLNMYWHPLARNVMITTSADKLAKFWDIGAGGGEKLSLTPCHDQAINSITWNYDGTIMATTSKDKMLRLIDPRSNTMTASTVCHEGAKGARAIWLGDSHQLVTLGFKKGNPEREIAFFDARNLTAGRTASFNIDTSPSSMFPFYDPDLKLLYVLGKGDGNMRVFEVTNQALPLQEAGEFRSPNAQAGFAMLPKLSCEVMKCEIARFLKLQGTSVVPIRMEITRQTGSYVFQQDLYPDTFDGKAVYEADEWFGGAAPRKPNLVSIKPPES